MSFVFTDPYGKAKITLLPNQIVPPAYRPDSNDPQLTFTYIVPSMKNLRLPLPPSVAPPAGSLYISYANSTPKAATVNPNPPQPVVDWSPVNTDDPIIPVSSGQNYVAPSGTTIYLPQGQPIPGDWKPAGQITNLEPQSPTKPIPVPKVPPPDLSAADNVVSPGGYYTMVGAPTYMYIYIPTGALVPSGFKIVNAGPQIADLPKSVGGYYTKGDESANIYILEGGNVPPGYTLYVKSPPPPPPPKYNSNLPDAWQLAANIGAVVGVAGISYLGYLYIFKPSEIRAFIVRFEELKTLVVDSSQMLVAIGILVALSFFSYEFAVSYANKGTFTGAIADMIARGIEEFVTIFFDVLGDLIKEAWDFVIGEIKSILPSWL